MLEEYAYAYEFSVERPTFGMGAVTSRCRFKVSEIENDALPERVAFVCQRLYIENSYQCPASACQSAGLMTTSWRNSALHSGLPI
jgi:hypothetical protein